MQGKFFRCLNLLVLLSGFSLRAFGQEEVEDRSSFAGLRFGILIPNKSIYNPPQAESPQLGGGVVLAGEGAWLPHRNFGLGGSLQYISAVVEMPDPYSSVPGKVIFPDTNAWRSFTVSAGPYFSIPFTKFSIETKLYAGYTFTRAYNKIIYYEAIKPSEEQRLMFNHNAFSLQSGLTFRLDIKPGLSVAAIYDHLLVFPTHKLERVIDSNPSVTVNEKLSPVYHMPSLSLAFIINIPHYVISD